jgi:hypothetical protein
MIDSIISFLTQNIFENLCVVALPSLLFMGTNKKDNKSLKNIASLYTGLGVTFTFIGIWGGLQAFDQNQIAQSLPTILDRFKTSFSTSIVGMVVHMIASHLIDIWRPLKDSSDHSSDHLTRWLDKKFSSDPDWLDKKFSSDLRFQRSILEFQQNISGTISSIDNTMSILLAEIIKQNNQSSTNWQKFHTTQNLQLDTLSSISLEMANQSGLYSRSNDLLQEIIDQNNDQWHNLLIDVIEKLDDKIETRLKTILESLTFTTSQMLEIVEENHQFQQKLIDDREIQMIASHKMAENSVKASEGFKSLVESYLRMEKNATTTGIALEQVATLGGQARESARNMQVVMDTFRTYFTEQYNQTITKATEQQAAKKFIILLDK